MTKVEAIIRPDMLSAAMAALDDLGLHGLTVTRVQGKGKQRGWTERYRSATYPVNLLDKTKIEVIVHDDRVDEVMEAIADAISAGETGDGKVFTYKLDNAMSITTREIGEAVLNGRESSVVGSK